jgi:DNA-binding transcriptional regulator YiaG
MPRATLRNAKDFPSQYSDFPNLLGACGLSSADLARRVGVHPSTVSSWTTGRARPPGAVIAYLRLLAAIRGAPGVLRGKE